jgi:hypothetical protein
MREDLVQIWISDHWISHPGVIALEGMLTARAFTARVAYGEGYDLNGCGTRITK